MLIHQSIQRPLGINVFGSHVIRVDPDVAVLSFGVARTEPDPPAAFSATRAAADRVRGWLEGAGVPSREIERSRVTLGTETRGYGKEYEFLGYRAHVGFGVRITDLDRLEAILTGIVESGANVIEGTALKTTRLAELRARAREEAFAAAKRKAELYASAAGVTLGSVLHVEDLNPDAQRGRGHGADVDLGADEPADRPHAPGSIEVSAAVMVGFAIESVRTRSGFG